MDEKRTPLVEEEPRYKKKSKSKGQPRSKHKHIYETVLLYRYWRGIDYETGRERIRTNAIPTKVCTICGRTDDIDEDPSYYVKDSKIMYWFTSASDLSERALNLPKWYVEDYFDKFAIKMEEGNNI